MRAIAVIALLLVGCGDDTNVTDMKDMTISPSLCERQGNCCCGGTIAPGPSPCIAMGWAGIGQPCSQSRPMCIVDEENGGRCYCATSGTWACIGPFSDLAVYPPLDMTTHD